MSNWIGTHWGLFSMALNQLITLSVFFHWLNFRESTKLLFTFSNIALLIFPSSLFDGCISGHGWLVLKFSLYYLRVINAGVSAKHSILSSKLMFFAIYLASIFIEFSKLVNGENSADPKFNCRSKSNCPRDGNCQKKRIDIQMQCLHYH